MPSQRPRILLVNRCMVKNKGKILLIQRAKDEWWNPNKWEFPGGKLDEGQDVSNALEREVLEETSLLVKVASPLGYFESYIVSNSSHKAYNGLPLILIVGVAELIGGTIKLSEEHQAYKWVSQRQALKMDMSQDCKKALIALTRTTTP